MDSDGVGTLNEHGKTVVNVVIDGEACGAIALADIVLVKSNPKDVVAMILLTPAT
jgi:cation transport ATPase